MTEVLIALCERPASTRDPGGDVKALLAELVGTQHRFLKRQRYMPMPTVWLEIGPDALAVLERSQLVTRVYFAEELDRSKVRPEVAAQVAETGVASVGVELTSQAVPYYYDPLSPDRVRHNMEVAYQTLRPELAGAPHKVLSKSNYPVVWLEVGAEALQRLERSTLVKDVYLSNPGGAPYPKVRPDVAAWVEDRGVARVSVRLSGQWELDSKLSRDAALAQRAAIAAVQQRLIGALAGTQYKDLSVPSLPRFGPFISLQIGADALKVLAQSPLVMEVYLDEGLLKLS